LTVLGASTLLALACGGLWARLGRAAGESGFTTFTRGALGAIAAIVAVEELLGACGILGARAILLVLGVACLGLATVAWRLPRVEPRAPRTTWTSLEAGLLAALLAALGTRLWDGLHRTTFLYDTLSYHLHAPATWLRDGRLSIVPAVFGDPAPAYAPSNVELVFLFLMAPTRSGALAQAGQAPLAALACAAVAATVREAGGTRAGALGAALALALVPEVWQQAASAMTDVGVAAFFLAALPFLVRWVRARPSVAPGGAPAVADAAAFGLAVGLCAGSKVVGLVFALPLVGVATVACARSGRRGPRLAAVTSLAVLVTGGFWYVRNLVVTGNPVYPLAVEVGKTTLAPGIYDAAVLRASAYHVARGDLSALGHLLLEPGVAFALGGGLALALGARRRPAWTLLALALVGLFWLAVPYQESRFLFPAWGVVAVAMAMFGCGETARGAPAWVWAPLALGVVGSVVEHPTAERWGVLGVGAAALVGFPPARAWLRAREGRRVGRALAPTMVVLAAIALGLTTVRAPAYGVGDELDEAWAWFRQNVRGARVAYTGNNLPFPLAGDELSNDVRYVNVAGAPGDRLHDFARRSMTAPRGPEPAPYRDDARYETWLGNLRAARRDVLFVAALYPSVRRTIATDADGFPVERAWADAHPEFFTPRFASTAARVYGVAP
jgi:hypothetical protein